MEHFDSRRYLVSFDTASLPQVFSDVLVIGTGVAGLRAARAAADHCEVLVVAKRMPEETNTARAQGGTELEAGEAYERPAGDMRDIDQGNRENTSSMGDDWDWPRDDNGFSDGGMDY